MHLGEVCRGVLFDPPTVRCSPGASWGLVLEKLFSCLLLKMPKKSKIVEVPVPEPEIIEEKKEEIKISKRTGKPTRPLTELQMETLRKGRELAVAKRKQLLEGIDLEKRAQDIKKAKDEMKLRKILFRMRG